MDSKYQVIVTDGVTDTIYSCTAEGTVTLTSDVYLSIPFAQLEFPYSNVKVEPHRGKPLYDFVFYNNINPEKIIKNPAKNATTVKWEDGTYTTVKRSPDDPEDDYSAFTAALAIKLYGSNSAVKRMITKKTETLNKKKKEKKDEGSE